MRVEKITGDRQDVEAAEDDGRRDRQLAARLAVFASGGAFSFIDLFQNALCCLDITAAGLGEYYLTACSDQKLGAEVRFKVRNLSTDRRERYPYPFTLQG